MPFNARNSKQVSYANAPIEEKHKFRGRKVVSRAFVKEGATNLVPRMHVRAGDTVILTTGSEKVGKGKTGKVLHVFPKEGKIIVEGINIITRATKAKTPMAKSGHVKKEGKIFASRVQLFCTSCKKPTRAGHKVLEGGKKTRICRKCNESFDA